jgi:hypothetical protein
MRYILFLSFFTLFACSDTSSGIDNDMSKNEVTEHPFPAFQDFPIHIYTDIQPGSTYERLVKNLSENHWTQKSAEETCIYEHTTDSTTIIFRNHNESPTTIIGEMKLFLSSKTYIDQSEAFLNFLEKKSDVVQKNGAFAILKVENPVPYTITVFTQPNFIRLFIYS